MTLRRARNGEVELACETFGSPEGEPLLLTTGNMCQMVWWPEDFCAALAERGFHVARFDNRDSGLSTHFHSHEPQHPVRTLFSAGDRAHTSADMVEDAMAVLDALGWSRHTWSAARWAA
ncbi:pimeloyl-ACP methyl ester carboxylesterase [Saccharopolyspora lacisalsi]|uniref:Pimeloyl-ACP methyl ester carboxylesterase n=1 Tax=Halosaccharopolyspora lacisalsi TaxID=1000566 RepID=A0A839DUI8_9PSEU|nr:hypothetical protein [Halosaccharopolyspora lacisalsi]MBA8822811.1 pimeloyl-ACP methyl ester carboxylesterase [Halosaccharopolyspora lacisalsi]